MVASPRGRGRQLRAGVAAAKGCWLLILHADARLSPPAVEEAERAVGQPEVRHAAWPLRIDGEGWWLRWVERGAALRWRMLGLAYGDQGLLVRRDLYEAAGGFPDTAIMEDVILARRLGQLAPMTRFTHPIVADGRRWRREGAVRGSLRNLALLLLFLCWRGARSAGAVVSAGAADPMTPAIAVFLKAPRLGQVKSRLAAEIGARQALRLYRVMAAPDARGGARERSRGHRLVRARRMPRPRCRYWLGEEWDLRPQASGDLGARLAASTHGVEVGRGWIALGADCPAISTPRSCARPRRS